MSPTYDMLLRDPRIPVGLHIGVPASNPRSALQNVLKQYGCPELIGEVEQQINEGNGQLLERPYGTRPMIDSKGSYVQRIRYEKIANRKRRNEISREGMIHLLSCYLASQRHEHSENSAILMDLRVEEENRLSRMPDRQIHAIFRKYKTGMEKTGFAFF